VRVLLGNGVMMTAELLATCVMLISTLWYS